MGLPALKVHADAGTEGGSQLCPNCGSILVQSLLHGRNTHLCPRGHGRAYSASSVRAWIVDDFQVEFGLALQKSKTGKRSCPHCLKRFQLSPFYRLPIEHCKACSLVWLGDGLLGRLPLRPEKEREHAGNSVSIPVQIRFDPGVELVDEICSPFQGVRYGSETPWATLALAVTCALVTGAFWFLGEPGYFVALPREPLRNFGLPLLLSIFAHADWTHLFGNGYFLFVAGSVLESNMGWRRYLALFFACAAGAKIGQALNTDAGSIGASGAISGLVVALVATQPKAFYVFRPWGSFFGVPLLGNLCTVSLRIPIWLWAFAWFGLDLFLMSRPGGFDDGVGHAAHLAGAVVGALLASQPYFQGAEAAAAARSNASMKRASPRRKAIPYHK